MSPALNLLSGTGAGVSGAACRELTEVSLLSAASIGAFERPEKVEDVTQLVFRSRGLESLSTPGTVDLSRLAGSLEVLSLSGNRLKEIKPLSALASLVEVNINFNQVADLRPLFECDLLEKLFASHNVVTSVVGLEAGCPKLRELSILSNCIGDREALEASLRGLPDLRSLDVGQNPCMVGSGTRYALLQALPTLESLDGAQLTELDRSLASSFLEGRSSRESAASGDGAPLARPCTAPPATLAASPQPSASDTGAAGAGGVLASPPQRPRPPSLPLKQQSRGGGGGYPSAGASGGVGGCGGLSLSPLPGQKLRSSRANRMDEVLTTSASAASSASAARDPSPEVQEGGNSPADAALGSEADDPGRALAVLKAHQAALVQQLETLQMERENLKFQVRLLQRDQTEARPEWLEAKVAQLEAEARNAPAVESERQQLEAKYTEVEKAFAELLDAQEEANAAGVGAGGEKAKVDDEELEELRWEGKLLEKRLDRTKRAGEKLRQDSLRAQLQSSYLRSEAAAAAAAASGAAPDAARLDTASRRPGTGLRPGTTASLAVAGKASSSAAAAAAAEAAGDKEVARLLSGNEEMLSRLRDEVRDTATAISLGRPWEELKPPTDHKPNAVDVLTIGEGAEGADVEWHGTAGAGAAR